VLQFTIDQAALPPSGDGLSVGVLRNGVPCGGCTGPAGHAVPNPCVAERTILGGDLHVLVLTSQASDWNLVVPLDGATTSTTVPGTTTTSTTLCTSGGCDDGDPCTDDPCVPAIGCVHSGPDGFEGIACRCATTPAVCSGQAVPAQVRQPFSAACTTLSKLAVRTGPPSKKGIRKAVTRLEAAARKASKASRGRRPKITPACSDGLRSLFGDVGSLAQGLIRRP
jgi:hypothetical protein